MAITVFPSANGVGGAGQKVLSEGNLAGWSTVHSPRNYIASGFDVSGASSNQLTISPGAAFIGGRYIVSDADIYVPVSGSGFASCRLVCSVDAIGNITGCGAELVGASAPLGPYDLHLAHVYVSVGKVSYIDYTQGRFSSPYGTVRDEFINRYMEFNTHFESIDGYATSVASSGTVTLDGVAGCVKLATSATANSSATIIKRSYTAFAAEIRERPDFYLEQWLSICGEIYGVAVNAASEAWLIVGAPGNKRHIGFVSVGGELFGTIGNGTKETRTARLSESKESSMIAHYVPGKYAEFWVGLRGYAKLTTDLPVGYESASADRAILYASIKTTNTTAKELRLANWRWRQGLR